MRQGFLRTTTVGLSVVALCAVGGCKKSQPARPHPAKPATAAKTEAPARTPGAAPTATASVPGKSDPLCVGPIDLKPPKTFDLADWHVKTEGYRVTLTPKTAKKGNLVLGVMSDIKEDTGENLFNIKRDIEWFKKQGVQAVVIAGDTGETVPSITHSLDAIAAPGWPVFVIVGNRPAKDVYADGVAGAQKDHPNLFDLNQRRLVRLPDVSLVSLPGYYDPRFLHHRNGCQYFVQDVDATQKMIASDVKGPAVLISHGPPRGTTDQAIDNATQAGNTGDPNLNTLITADHVAYGIFGNIEEAGGKATDLTGTNIVDPGKFVKSFYLNPGPADSVGWEMNDGTESHGMVAVMTVRPDGMASYQVNRLAPLTKAEEAEAAKLTPSDDKGGDASGN